MAHLQGLGGPERRSRHPGKGQRLGMSLAGHSSDNQNALTSQLGMRRRRTYWRSCHGQGAIA